MTSVLTENQKKVFEKDIMCEGKPHQMRVTLRYDDECRNGHNTFSITGSVWKSFRGRDCEACGCLHEEIEKYFPEFKHLIKWHLVSSDGPLHYIANTTYWAKDRENMALPIGAPVGFEKALKFKEIPLMFDFKNSFYDFISSVKNWDDVKIISLEHRDSGAEHKHQFKPKYTFEGTGSKEWARGEFDTLQKAREWLEMFKTFDFEIVEIPVKWNEASAPNLEHARSCAIWEEATLEQLQDEKALKKRLPKIMKEFKKDIEALGFIY